ncbi:MAG: hypothetical protein ABW205_13185 [Burkholderiales bacterium]
MMKCKILLSMFATGVLAATALPAAADDWLADQLAQTDGYAKPIDIPEPNHGAAGRPGGVPADDGWLDRQLQLTDGYAEPTAVTAYRAGAEGRSGRFQEPDDWLERQLEMTDG